ncbi:MAG: hypothetical protein ACRDJ9_15220, partial [Dehalococcoidia bacterium]
MHHQWRAALAGAFTLLIALAAAIGAPFRAAAADELETRTISTYEVRADGSVHVTISARVTNRDPSTQRAGSGRVFYYSAAPFTIHHGATNLTARTGSTRLSTESSTTPVGGDPFRLLAVRFDRDLYYNDVLDITVEYDLAAIRASQILVSPEYAFVPAVGQGAYSLLQIVAPADRRVTIGSANCAHIADSPITYACGTSTTAADYRAGGRCFFTAATPRWDCAFTGDDFVIVPLEVTAPNLTLATRTSQVTLVGRPVQLTVSHFTGDEAWAARVEDIVRRGLPLLEEANGYAYAGPPTIEILESGYQDTHGYEGLANNQGRLRLTPVVDDQTVLHEVSHLWSSIFASRWLAEGMADYTANIAARRLGLRPSEVPRALPPEPTLEEWGALRSQIALNPSERDVEESGYARSLRFIEILAERAGARTLMGINATLAQERARATSRTYLDLLEDTTGAVYAPLFAEWVFTEADIQLLPARQAARAAAATLSERAAAAGTSRPRDVDDALHAWEFDRAQQLVQAAGAALDAHEQNLARATNTGYGLGDRFTTIFGDSAEQALDVAQREARALEAVSG